MDKSIGRNIILLLNLGQRQKLLLIDKSWSVFAKNYLTTSLLLGAIYESRLKGLKGIQNYEDKKIREYRKNVMYRLDG